MMAELRLTEVGVVGVFEETLRLRIRLTHQLDLAAKTAVDVVNRTQLY